MKNPRTEEYEQLVKRVLELSNSVKKDIKPSSPMSPRSESVPRQSSRPSGPQAQRIVDSQVFSSTLFFTLSRIFVFLTFISST
ncbi:unnamed protein product [Gongylonema pulchrum]|uniref:Ovule protein n=1 Tax=Gongylonema pulchrum TaxID=637853 RepID=A0A183DHF2_9BILA|nr:unnamed protein product [Gongylonema pulchrum]